MNEDATRIQAASQSADIEASLIRHLLPAFIMKAVVAAYFFSAYRTINYTLCHVIK
jgi:hypothetical protein